MTISGEEHIEQREQHVPFCSVTETSFTLSRKSKKTIMTARAKLVRRERKERRAKRLPEAGLLRKALVLCDRKSLEGFKLEAMECDYKNKKSGREKLECCNRSSRWN